MSDGTGLTPIHPRGVRQDPFNADPAQLEVC